MLHELQHKQVAIRLDRTLDHFAIASNVAIVRDEGQATLDACRSYLEAWLRPLAERTGEVRIKAEKRMTARAYVGKSRKTLPVSAFQADKTWLKLFDAATERQRARQPGGKVGRSARSRGWTREELDRRGRAR